MKKLLALLIFSIAAFGQCGSAGKLVILPGGQKSCAPISIGALGTFTARGAYAAGTTYAALDLVSYDGVAYVAVAAANTGHTPSSSPTWWASVGPAGAQGQAGSVGPSGTVSATSGITFDQQSACTTPAADKTQMCVKTDGKAYIRQSNGTETAVGSGSASYWSKTIVLGGQNSAISTTDVVPEGPRVPVTFTGGVTLTSCTIGATTGPAGAALTLNILKNGVQAATCVIADGATTGSSTPGVAFAASDHITFSVASATWTTAPRGVSAEILFTVPGN